MPINHKAKIIFIHIPKAAGSSIERFVKESTGESWDLWGKIKSDDEVQRRYPDQKEMSRFDPDRVNNSLQQNSYHHLTLSDVKAIVGEQIYSNYAKFCVIRNPWDRLVSFYEYGRQRPQRRPVDELPFKEWFYERSVTTRILPYLRIDGRVSQDVRMIDFANFEIEFYALMQEFGLERMGQIHEKKSERKHYTEYYTEEMAEELAEDLAEDISYFNFQFGSEKWSL